MVGWSVFFGIVPLTGWWSEYKYVPRLERINLGRIKYINCVREKEKR